jgi:hypothetical protein
MNYIIQTGTDGNGDAITTTLDVQWSWTYELVSHETQNFVNNQSMPTRRVDNMVKQVEVKVTGTDTTTGNASHLQSGVSSQTHSINYMIPLPWRNKANGEMTGFVTPYDNLTSTMILNFGKAILQESEKVARLEAEFAWALYGRSTDNPDPDS